MKGMRWIGNHTQKHCFSSKDGYIGYAEYLFGSGCYIACIDNGERKWGFSGLQSLKEAMDALETKAIEWGLQDKAPIR